MQPKARHEHSQAHAFSFLNAREREGLTVFSRRSVLKAGLLGFAGLTFTNLLRLRAETAAGSASAPRHKALILLWMIYHHFGVPLDATYLDHQGRPLRIVEHGEPIRELI